MILALRESTLERVVVCELCVVASNMKGPFLLVCVVLVGISIGDVHGVSFEHGFDKVSDMLFAWLGDNYSLELTDEQVGGTRQSSSCRNLLPSSIPCLFNAHTQRPVVFS